MTLKRKTVLFLTLFMFVFGFAASSFAAEDIITATNKTLTVNGWQMVEPSYVINKKTNEQTVYWHMQGKGDEKKVLKRGEKAEIRWVKKGHEGWNSTPSGYAAEDTNNIIKWYKKGGRGTYKMNNGKFVPVKPSQKPKTQSSKGSGNDATPFGDKPVKNVPIQKSK